MATASFDQPVRRETGTKALSSERHRRLTELFAAVADAPSAERHHILQSIEHDKSLIADCLELLAADDASPGDFLAPGSLRFEESTSDVSEPPFQIGDQLDNYRIVELLGRGGMGCVYRAEDPSLRRDVAIKTLAKASADERQHSRFLEEGRSLAALDHPNVVTVHAVGEAPTTGGSTAPYLVMELVHGQRLDQVAGTDGLSLQKFCNVARDLLSGVAAAHRCGIVHRDLKPSNVMITELGQTKVLDFGLARTESPRPSRSYADEATKDGALIGTIPFMSPEQVSGQPADRRSDVFSLGSVLYFAATGRSPFAGSDDLATLSNILTKDPPALRTIRPDLSRSLESLIERALSKAPEERYSSADDMRSALDQLASRANRPWKRGWVQAAAAAMLFGVLGLTWIFATAADDSPLTAIEGRANLNMQPLTTSGTVISAALSPDGQRFSYVESVDGLQGLYVRNVAGGPSLELVPPRPIAFWGHSFSSDGTQVFYGLRGDPDRPGGAYFQISTLGGSPQHLVDGIDSTPAVSPDGSQIAWYRLHPDGEDELLIADLASGEERRVASPQGPYRYGPTFFGGVAFSPNGKRIAVAEIHPAGEPGRIALIDIATGTERWSVTDPRWTMMGQVAWAPDHQALLVVAGGKATSKDIWRIPLWSGDPVRLTVDLNSYRTVSLSRNGDRLVTVPSRLESGLWSGEWPPRGEAERVTRERPGAYAGIDYSSDGALVFTQGGSLQLVKKNQQRPTFVIDEPGTISTPHITEQGSALYAKSRTAGNAPIIREVDLQTRIARDVVQLPQDAYPLRLSYTQNAVYSSNTAGNRMYRTPLDGGPTTQLGESGYLPFVSPDGDQLAYYQFVSTATVGPSRIVVRSLTNSGGIDDAVPPILIEHLAATFPRSFLRWTPNGDALLVNTAAGDRANLWRLPLDGNAAERLTDFTEQDLLAADFSPDESRWTFLRGGSLRDAVLIEGALGPPSEPSQ